MPPGDRHHPPGTPARKPAHATLPKQLLRDAVVSPCGRYRYELFRRWARGPIATWIMCNPSTADEHTDDATVRRVISFSRDVFECGACTIVNLYAYRATLPRALWLAADPVGPDNDTHLRTAIEAAADARAPLIGAWGAHPRQQRITAVMQMPGAQRITALATTQTGQPAHPLYLPGHLRPAPWSCP